MKKHEEEHMRHKGRHERKSGGRSEPMVAAGNPDVIKEAEDDAGDEDEQEKEHRKKGGKVKKHRAKGGKVIGLMTGGGVKPRLDRPGRKSGGAVGANRSPLSTAHVASGGTTGSSNPTDTYGGTPK